MFRAKIHRATVTEADIDYIGSISIDQDLLDAADILVNERVEVWNITNGNRLYTYAISGERGSGVIGINGAAAHHVQPGDLVIIAAFGNYTEDEAHALKPTVIMVDEKNRQVYTEMQLQ